MKKQLPFIVFIAFLIVHGEAVSQVNDYFLNDPVWKVSIHCKDQTGYSDNCYKKERWNYSIKGDSVINSLVYKKIFKAVISDYYYQGPALPPNIPNNCSGSYQAIGIKPHYLVRSAGKKIFARPAVQGSNESLLYDFDLHVGDTIPVTSINGSSNTTVASIDSVFTPYGYRKRFALTGKSYTLIEGVGHNWGFLEYMGTILSCGHSNLECYSLNGISYYPSSALACELDVSIASQDRVLPASVFPNPSSGIFNVEAPGAIGQIEVFDLLGKKLMSFNPGSSSTMIDLAEAPHGVYFMNVITGNEILAGKLIKE